MRNNLSNRKNNRKPQKLSTAFSAREVYEGIIRSLKPLTDASPLEFEAVSNGILAESFEKAVSTINSAEFSGSDRQRESLLRKYLALAVGLLVTAGINLNTINLLNLINRQHKMIMEEFRYELSY